MSLRQQAESALSFIVENTDHFGWAINVTDPAGLSKGITGFSADIQTVIDTDTGTAVSGRTGSVSLRMSTLTTLGFTSLPVGIADAGMKPWIVVFDDINGNEYTFKVKETLPDRELGLITCILEAYTP